MQDEALPGAVVEGAWRDKVTWYTHETSFLRVIRFLGDYLTSPFTRLECVGFEHIPLTGPCILASNHLNNLDAVFYGAHLPRHTCSMAKKELFDIPIFGWALRMCAAFPVYRGERDEWALKQAGRVLADGEILFLFPEGTRGGPEAKLRQGKIGSVKLALQHKVPLIPAAILGTHNFRLTLGRKNYVRMEVGQPLDVVSLAGSPPYEYETLRDLTTSLMQKIAAMLPPAHRGVYGD